LNCGPTSNAALKSTTCQCIGNNRRFLKTIGACLCAVGFKRLDGRPDEDSIENCERIVYQACSSGKVMDHTGFCMKEEDLIA